VPSAVPRVPAIDVAEAHRRLQAEARPFVLDVREPWEYALGHVPGARLLPLGELCLLYTSPSPRD